MDYAQMLSFLYSMRRTGKKWSLREITALLKLLGNPEKSLEFIHVAGTNGKGSVTSMVSSILAEAGYKVGSYYSPHVDSYCERIQLNGKLISPQRVLELFQEILPAREKVPEASFFEITTAMALKFFEEEAVDYVVLEAGLGGRLDATNACDSLVSVITNVDLEHMSVLGDTVESIAREKAEIIKPNSSFVTGETKKEAWHVFEEKCKREHARLLRLGKDFYAKKVSCTCEENIWAITAGTQYEARLRLLGEHQGTNAGLSVAAVESLEERISTRAMEDGLAKAFIPARLEVWEKNPLILMDAAHNPAAMRALAKSLCMFSYDKLILVTGVMGDKDIPGIMREIAPKASAVVANQPKVARAADAGVLAREAKEYCENVLAVSDVRESFNLAKELAGANDLVLLTGSIYMLSEARGRNEFPIDQ